MYTPMMRCWLWVLSVLLTGRLGAAAAQSNNVALVQRQWFETRTAHFNIYSCGTPQDVYKLSARLEQFCQAYTLLVGSTQAVASPPIVVMAFPNHEALKPFLPIYQGQPANLAAFFQRGNDENLIVLGLPDARSVNKDMEVIFHEYTHLLFRKNDRLWPLWLKEGLAEVYSTFETTGYTVRLGQPIDHHLRLLAQQPLLPLAELFAVGHDSPQYNERDRQGIFYAESWLLTEFLMAGDNSAFKARFGPVHRPSARGPVYRSRPLPMHCKPPCRRWKPNSAASCGQNRFTPIELPLGGQRRRARQSGHPAAHSRGELLPPGR